MAAIPYPWALWIDLTSWLFLYFSVATALCVAFFLTGVVASLFIFGMRQLLHVAVLIEALMEAKRQGRAPLLRAWQWLDRKK